MKKKLLWMLTGLALVLAFGLALGGCSRSAPSPAPAESIGPQVHALTQEQIAAEAARQAAAEKAAEEQAEAEKLAAEKAAAGQAEVERLEAEKLAAEKAAAAPDPSPAQASGSSSPAPAAAPAAPKYAIGDKGPGGGIVFSNRGGKYKEVIPKAYSQEEHKKIMFQTPVGFLEVSPINGYSDWALCNSLTDLRAIYANLQKTGKVNFGDVWVRADWLKVTQAHNKPYNPMGEMFPGYGVYLTSGGNTHYFKAIHLSDGKEGVVIDASVGYCYLVGENDEPDTGNRIPEFYLVARQF